MIDLLTRLALNALGALPPETAHDLALRALAAGLAPGRAPAQDPILATTLWGLRFASPLGVAAGFDKNARAPDALPRLGAGFMEIGAVTPRPQPGNPKPRLFRLSRDRAVINRMGFNNDGLEAVAARLAARRRAGARGVLGVNLGANKDSADRIADYEIGLRRLHGLADFFTVNVSSPNTEGLRALQGRAALRTLLTRVLAARDSLTVGGRPAPVLLKISPDLAETEIQDVAEVALETGVDGIVATNTTLARPESLRSPLAREAGGLSGAPLLQRSTEVLRALRRATEGRTPLIGVGGVDGPEAAYAKIRAGATLVQLYTAMIWRGPALFPDIAQGLAERLRRDGFTKLEDAVGVDA